MHQHNKQLEHTPARVADKLASVAWILWCRGRWGEYLDDDGVGGEIDPPGECGRADETPDEALREIPFYQVPVRAQHPRVVSRKPNNSQKIYVT